MIKIGMGIIQVLVQRPAGGAALPVLPGLDFSNALNSGYRGFYV